MSDILASVYSDAFSYSSGVLLSQPAAGFICSTGGTLTLQTGTNATVALNVTASVVYPIAFVKISLGSASGLTALRAAPFGGRL